MKIELWPGGSWYRDLGDGNGHFWGNVQAIKRPTLLEITGPLFMSYPVDLECAVSPKRGRRRNADQVPSRRARDSFRMTTGKVSGRVGQKSTRVCGRKQKPGGRNSQGRLARRGGLSMCPACIASATLMAGGAITTGGVTALVGRVLQPERLPAPGITAIQTKGE